MMAEKEDSGRIIVPVPIEIWTCALAVREHNPNAPFEAFLVLCALESVRVEALVDVFGELMPWSTLADLTRRGALVVHANDQIELGPLLEDVVLEYETIKQRLLRTTERRTEIRVVRDLLTGKFHHMRVCKTNISLREGDVRLHDEWGRVDGDPGVPDVIAPYRAHLQKTFNMKTTQLYGAIDLIQVEKKPSVVDIAFTWDERNDGTRMARVNGKDNDLGIALLNAGVIPELRPQRTASDVRRAWEPSPEIKAIEAADVASKYIRACQKKMPGTSWAIGKELMDEAVRVSRDALQTMQKEADQRLNMVESITGTEWEQWQAAKEVIKSAQKRCVILSAFSHEGFADAVAARLNEATSENASVMLLSGEPNRINEPGFDKKLEIFLAALKSNGCAVDVRGHLTVKATHAKFVVSDKGEVWLGSCNLLSAAPDSWVLETGLRAQDANLARAILEWSVEEGFYEGKVEDYIQAMLFDIRGLPQSPMCIRKMHEKGIKKACENLSKTKSLDEKSSRGANRELNLLITIFRAISERPRWTLVTTSEHRPLVLDMVRNARKSISLGSDGVSAQGLDQALCMDISQQPVQVPHRTTKFQVNVFWGRHDPSHVPKKDREAVKAAGVLIDDLRRAVRKHDGRGRELRVLFQPYASKKPMMTHAKFVAVDGTRVLITSDNLLSFGDDEERNTDASELGILLDHPRSSKEVVADMQFWTPKTQDPYNRDRWYGRVGAIAKRYDGIRIPATQAIEELTLLAKSSDITTDDFFVLVSSFKIKGEQMPVEFVPYQLIQEAEKDGFVYMNFSVGEGKNKLKSGLTKFDRNIAMDDERLERVVIRSPRASDAWGIESDAQSPSETQDFGTIVDALLLRVDATDGWVNCNQLLQDVWKEHPNLKRKGVMAWLRKHRADLFEFESASSQNFRRRT